MTTPGTAPAVSRLRIPEEDELPDDVRAFFAEVRSDGGFVRNYFRAHSLNPANFMRAIPYLLGLLDPDQGQLSSRERELIAVVVSRTAARTASPATPPSCEDTPAIPSWSTVSRRTTGRSSCRRANEPSPTSPSA